MRSAVRDVAAMARVWSVRAKSSMSSASSMRLATQEGPSSPHTPPSPTSASPRPGTPTPITPGMSDASILALLKSGALPNHALESHLGDAMRAVGLRRQYVESSLGASPLHATSPSPTTPHSPPSLAAIPFSTFDAPAFYKSVLNTNCEAVIGFIPYPLGVVGPLPVDGVEYRVPMATTEGALVASTNRGCTALRRAGGVVSEVVRDGMTRAPLLQMPSLKEAAALKAWVEAPANTARLQEAFSSTSRFGKLASIDVTLAGRLVYMRFVCTTGDAMGMNMISKGVNVCLDLVKTLFPTVRVMALSGNMCTDKKPSAVNWVSGRGKSVVCEARIPGSVLRAVLKTSAGAMAELNVGKNLVGSALAGSVGGFNAHASNIVTALYLATGQDPAQNVESSNCLTLMEVDESVVDPNPGAPGGDTPGLLVSVTMPCIEVGTVGGGTSLAAQASCLEMMGIKGSNTANPGANARQLARIVASTVMAGEVSLMAALTSNDLINSHLKLNRKPSTASSTAGGGGPEELPSPPSQQHQGSGSGGGGGGGGGGGAHRPHHFQTPTHHHSHSHHSHHHNTDAIHPHPLHMSHSGESLIPVSHLPGRRYFETASWDGSIVGGEEGWEDSIAVGGLVLGGVPAPRKPFKVGAAGSCGGAKFGFSPACGVAAAKEEETPSFSVP